MKYNKNVKKAEFINRPNRFNAVVKLEEEEITVHVPNTGRCGELLVEGYTVFLREENNPTRKTPYDLIAVYKGNKLISMDSQIPNKVVEEALKNKKIKKLVKYPLFLASTSSNRCFAPLFVGASGNLAYPSLSNVTPFTSK